MKRGYYTRRIAEFSVKYEKAKRDLLLLSVARFVVVLSGVTFGIILWRSNSILALVIILASLSLFFLLVRKYAVESFRMVYLNELKKINEKELQALEGVFTEFEDGSCFTDPHHDFSHDIDLFGKSSIYQYLNRTCTNRGSEILSEWLRSPFKLCNEFSDRQKAIAELSTRPDWRQEFEALGRINSADKDEIIAFNNWLKESPQFKGNVMLTQIIYLLPIAIILLLVLFLLNIIPGPIPVVLVLCNLAIIAFNHRKIKRIHSIVSKMHSFLRVVFSQLSHLETASFTSSYLKSLQSGSTNESVSVVNRIRRLSKIIQSFDNRLNMLLGVLLNGLFLWDLHCIIRLESWKKDAINHLPVWFEKVGEIDALNSLANYAWNNPVFVYPEVAVEKQYFISENLGHPLIPEKDRVNNDFDINKARDIIIITGANMAGKSTFLRTVAVNLVLAMTGSPVCASKFVFTPSELFSSMRTNDSLSDKESYFFAELKRLKRFKDKLEKGEKVFFILDEILKGTNSKDKSQGSRLFIEKILEFEATGLIATHDIALTKLSKDYDLINNKYFDIKIENDEVIFDYKLREGFIEKMNAALLMKQQGII